jgi:predicted TPR repeat methyltransferase
MPGSSDEGKDWLLAHYLDIAPATVVDIGPGLGTYATRFRPHHQAHWTGIEIYEPYVDWYDLRGKYDEVIVADARTVDLPSADLLVAGDVLEHMPAADAIALIDRMKAAAKHLFVSVPIVVYEQGEWGGNVHETHHYHWRHDEMIEVLAPAESWAGELLGAYRWDR